VWAGRAGGRLGPEYLGTGSCPGVVRRARHAPGTLHDPPLPLPHTATAPRHHMQGKASKGRATSLRRLHPPLRDSLTANHWERPFWGAWMGASAPAYAKRRLYPPNGVW
jgi:hypothetical protein